MKKSLILAFGCAMVAVSASAQNAQEVTYVEDPAQGYTFNRFKDNWFIQLEGGAGVGFTSYDKERDFGDRFAPAASIELGKWFSPLLGARIGGDFMSVKGLTKGGQFNYPYGVLTGETIIKDKYDKTKVNYFGATFDVMLNLSHWWCGYNPNRVYNAYFYAGAGLYWDYIKFVKDNDKEAKWHRGDDRVIAMRAGLVQEFNISKRFALGLDLRATALGNHVDGNNKTAIYAEALLTAAFKLGKVDWTAPIVPVCPPAENCDEYRARLQAADARISDLEAQLKACLNRPVEKVVEKVPAAPLATIYYTIGSYRLTSVDRKVLKSVANVMKGDTSKKYTITGWADNYTGTDAVNKRLRENRANTVAKQLVRYGVSEDQFKATTDNGNRVDLGDKCLTLDRCVTIVED